MSLPDPRPVDPFGLWQPRLVQPLAEGQPMAEGMPSFGLPDEPGAPEAEIAPTWTLDLSGGPDALTLRSQQVETIQAGLAQAEARAEALLNQRKAASAAAAAVAAAAAAGAAGSASFSIESTPLPAPEAELSALLDCLEQPGWLKYPAVSFDLEGTRAINWDELRQKLQDLMDSVNRQLLHFAWVDTRLDGRLLARTTVDWGGDLQSAWDPGLSPEQLAAHQRSLQLALASRAASLRTIFTVSQIAGKLALALTTPLGPLQLMALGWEFVQSVIMPLLKEVNG